MVGAHTNIHGILLWVSGRAQNSSQQTDKRCWLECTTSPSSAEALSAVILVVQACDGVDKISWVLLRGGDTTGIVGEKIARVEPLLGAIAP